MKMPLLLLTLFLAGCGCRRCEITSPQSANAMCSGDACLPNGGGSGGGSGGTTSDTVKLRSACTAVWDFQLDGHPVDKSGDLWSFQSGTVLVREPGVGRHSLTGTRWSPGAVFALADSVSAGTVYDLPCP